jgi:hypothetical protein
MYQHHSHWIAFTNGNTEHHRSLTRQNIQNHMSMVGRCYLPLDLGATSKQWHFSTTTSILPPAHEHTYRHHPYHGTAVVLRRCSSGSTVYY